MTYFRELPNLEYQSFLSDKSSIDDYLIVKNLFRRVKLRDDLQNVFTVFDKYQILDGSRPELVAEELYGSSQYDWVVLISAGITRIRDQWPLSDMEVYEYAEQRYGENLNAIHHYETIEIRDSQDRLILPAGKIVDQNFKLSYQDSGKTYTNESIIEPHIVNISNPTVGITNYEYEVSENDKKRTIYVLKPIYLQQVLMDTKKAMTYSESSLYVNDKLIKTENTRAILSR